MKRSKVGRPSKITPERIERFTDAVALGNYYKAAASLIGVSYETALNWLKAGAALDEQGAEPPEGSDDALYLKFFQQVTRAEAEAEILMVGQWKDAVPEDWRAARDFLARRFPDRWGPKSELTLGGGLDLSVDVEKVNQRLEQLRQKKLIRKDTDGD